MDQILNIRDLLAHKYCSHNRPKMRSKKKNTANVLFAKFERIFRMDLEKKCQLKTISEKLGILQPFAQNKIFVNFNKFHTYLAGVGSGRVGIARPVELENEIKK